MQMQRTLGISIAIYTHTYPQYLSGHVHITYRKVTQLGPTNLHWSVISTLHSLLCPLTHAHLMCDVLFFSFFFYRQWIFQWESHSNHEQPTLSIDPQLNSSASGTTERKLAAGAGAQSRSQLKAVAFSGAEGGSSTLSSSSNFRTSLESAVKTWCLRMALQSSGLLMIYRIHVNDLKSSTRTVRRLKVDCDLISKHEEIMDIIKHCLTTMRLLS